MARNVNLEAMDINTLTAHFKSELDKANLDLEQLTHNWKARVTALAICDSNTLFLYEYAQKYSHKQGLLLDLSCFKEQHSTLMQRQRIAIGKPTLMHPTIETLIVEVAQSSDLTFDSKVWVKPLYRLTLSEEGTILAMVRVGVDESLLTSS